MSAIVNNRTIVTWALKIDLLPKQNKSEEQLIKQADSLVGKIDPQFIQTLEELVIQDTYKRFGDFARLFYEEKPALANGLKYSVQQFAKGFEQLAAKQGTSSLQVGQLAAKAGLIKAEHIDQIEALREKHYFEKRPFHVILKHRYQEKLKQKRSGVVRGAIIGGVGLLLAAILYVVLPDAEDRTGFEANVLYRGIDQSDWGSDSNRQKHIQNMKRFNHVRSGYSERGLRDEVEKVNKLKREYVDMIKAADPQFKSASPELYEKFIEEAK